LTWSMGGMREMQHEKVNASVMGLVEQ
jgi:hypothetical protein